MYRCVGASLCRLLELVTLVPEHRVWGLVNIIKTNGLLLNTNNNLRYLDMLLKESEDHINFCEQGGLDQLAKLLNEKVMLARKEEDMLSKEEIEICLTVACRATQWMLDAENEKQAASTVQGWELKGVFVDALVHLTNRWGHHENIVLFCYQLLTVLSRVDNYVLQKAMQTQHLELQEMMEVMRGGGRASHLHHHPQTLPFIGALCSFAFERFKDEKGVASDAVAMMMMAVNWAAYKQDSTPNILLALILRAWDSETAFGVALRESTHIGDFLTNVFRSASRAPVSEDMALVIARLLPHALATGSLDLSVVAEELANAAQTALSLCIPPSEGSARGIAALRNVLTALRLLFVTEEAKSFILESHAGLFDKIKQAANSQGLHNIGILPDDPLLRHFTK